MAKHQFIIAAPRSNEGKTTITLGLLRLLRNKGIPVQAFKSGPDYIDPKFHELACGKRGVNLDLYMMSEEEIQEHISNYGAKAKVNCIEGVMGLFDGAQRAERSTAELAKLLQTPVILVVDAQSVAYSVAPLLLGFKNFDPSVQITGVIFNRVSSDRHYQFLKDACTDIGIPSLGYLNHIPEASIPSRHLGLNIKQLKKYDAGINLLASALEKSIDWQQLLQVTTAPRPNIKSNQQAKTSEQFRFAIAQDDAFNFTYLQHLTAMKSLGDVEFFSPLLDSELPDCDFLYLPGGYPECYLSELSANTSMLESIRSYMQAGGLAFAECGGMMYLGKEIRDEEGKCFSMVGHFDFLSSMKKAKLQLGYRSFQWEGSEFKGHEFHYSQIQNAENTANIGNLTNATGKLVASKVYWKNKVVASYAHLYLGAAPKLTQLINKIAEL